MAHYKNVLLNLYSLLVKCGWKRTRGSGPRGWPTQEGHCFDVLET